MVLDLKPAAQATLAALLPLSPTALRYAISYLFIAIVWVNHHRLLSFAHNATPQLILVELHTSVHGFTGTCFNRLAQSQVAPSSRSIQVRPPRRAGFCSSEANQPPTSSSSRTFAEP